MNFKPLAAAFAVCLVASCASAAPAPKIAYRIVDRIAGRDGGWDFASIDPVTNRLFVARTDAVERIDLGSRKVTDALAPARHAHAVLPIDNGATIFETDGESGRARFIAADSGKLLSEVATGAKPDAAFFDPATGLIAVMNADDGMIALIDPKTRTLAGKINVGGGLEFGVADGKGGAFVNIEDANAIARIDIRSRRRTGTIALPGCEGPTGLALVANGTRLISACANQVALVMDAASGKTLATLPIGSDPDAVLVDAKRGLAFIPCGGTGTLIAIIIADPGKIAVAAVIPTQRGAKTGAIDPRDGRIYLPTATMGAVKPGAKRGNPVPGSFTVLVLAPESKNDKAQFLDLTAFEPSRTLPAPPAAGSALEAIELKHSHALIDDADAAARRQAKADSDVEDPSIYDGVTGRDLKTLPNTWALLTLIQHETDLAIGVNKDFFNRSRPWGVDRSIISCEGEGPERKPARGYPSGHSGMGYSVGWTLAQLMPDKAGAILTRAKAYAVNREICGEHFSADTDASQVIGTLSGWMLINDPRLAGLYAAARIELTNR